MMSLRLQFAWLSSLFLRHSILVSVAAQVADSACFLHQQHFRRRRRPNYQKMITTTQQTIMEPHLQQKELNFASDDACTSSLSLSTTSNTESLASPAFNQADVEKYFDETLQALDPSFSITVNESHRKSMVRALLGWTKAELSAALTKVTLQLQWDAADEFLSQHKMELQQLQVAEDATQFASGLLQQNESRFRNQPPQKFFSFLARGRTYQGKFERLLDDVKAPTEWVQAYQNIIRVRDTREALAALVESEIDNNQLPDRTIQGLLSCVRNEFPPDTNFYPSDGGTSRGKQSEMNLLTYLEQVEIPKLMKADPESHREFRILSPVHIVVHQPHKGKNHILSTTKTKAKKCPYIIELPAHAEWGRKTSELDALVVEMVESTDPTTIRIWHFWEAKASLNPVTIGDALTKKAKSVQFMIRNNYLPESSLIMEGKRFAIDIADHAVVGTSGKTESASPRGMPKVGLYGKALMKPAPASRRLQTTIAERLLSSNVDVVLEQGLSKGRVSVPNDEVRKDLEPVLRLATELQPIMVETRAGPSDTK